MKALAVSASAWMVLSGCGSQASSSSDSHSQEPSSASASAIDTSVDRLESAVDATGLDCSWKRDPSPPDGHFQAATTCSLPSGGDIRAVEYDTAEYAQQVAADADATVYCDYNPGLAYLLPTQPHNDVYGTWILSVPQAVDDNGLVIEQLGGQKLDALLPPPPGIIPTNIPAGCSYPYAATAGPDTSTQTPSSQAADSVAKPTVQRLQTIICNQGNPDDGETLSDDLTDGGTRDAFGLHADVALGCTAGGSVDLSSEGILLVWNDPSEISGSVVTRLGACHTTLKPAYWVSDLSTTPGQVSWAVVNMTSLRVAMKVAHAADLSAVGPTTCTR